MALKFITKADPKTTLPEGGDRFLWDEIPPPAKKVEYADILKGKQKKPVDK